MGDELWDRDQDGTPSLLCQVPIWDPKDSKNTKFKAWPSRLLKSCICQDTMEYILFKLLA